MRGFLFVIGLMLAAGCGVQKLPGDTAPADDSGGDGGDGGDGGAPTEAEVFPDDDPELSVQIDGSGWGCEPEEGGDLGYFSSTNIYCQKETGGSTYETVTLTVDGDLSVFGRYPVLTFSYTLQVAQDLPTIYDSADPGDLVVQVLGYGETGFDDAETLFAESEGAGTFENGMAFSGLELVGWPSF